MERLRYYIFGMGLMVLIYLIAITVLLLIPNNVLNAQQEQIQIEVNGNGKLTVPKSLMTEISVDLTDISFKEALSVIAEKGKFQLNYNNDRLPLDQLVSISFENTPALYVLREILEATGTALTVTKDGQIAIIPNKSGKGTIIGSVKDKKTGVPLQGVNVIVPGTNRGAATDRNGNFQISNVSYGSFSVQASMIGYEKNQMENVLVNGEENSTITFELDERILSLSEVVVTPGQFSMMQKEPVMRQILNKEDIHTIPQMGEDVYRAIRRIPGVSGNDFSAKFTIRGGEHEEILVLLDGQELYEPFHLKDVNGGVLSIVDVMTIGGIDLMTGSFPSEYGDHMSGVFNIKSIDPDDQTRTSAGISFMNARLMSQGSFNNGKGDWIFSARRGYLDVVLALVNEDDDIVPRYSDVFGKFKYNLNERNHVAINILQANDTFKFVSDNDDLIESSYGNSYLWFTHTVLLNPNLTTSSILSVGQVTGKRKGIEFKPEDVLLFEVSDDRKFNFIGVKQDWKLSKGDRHLLSWGIDLKKLDANYDYLSNLRRFEESESGEIITLWDTTAININPDGNEFGVYLSDRFRISPLLIAEIGLRYDKISHTSDNDVSPRLNLLYRLGTKSTLRIGWGRFFQSQGINELDVEYGSQNFYRAQLAKRSIVGFGHVFGNGVDLRIEAYHIDLSRLRPRFDNLSQQLLAFPELEESSIELNPETGVSKGFEIYLKKDLGNKFSWWGSYGLSWAEEKIDAENVPKDFDQRHTIYIDTNYRPNPKWRINVAWQYHTGWPYTGRVYSIANTPEDIFLVEEAFLKRNELKLPAYHRMDLRINRYFEVGQNRMSTFLNITNLYNKSNVRSRELDFIEIGPNGDLITTIERDDNWFPLLPSIGVSMDF